MIRGVLVGISVVALWVVCRSYLNARPRDRRFGYGPAWEARRARYYRTHHRRCHACGADDRIDLHHIALAYSVFPIGQEPDEWLIPLCREHHDQLHRWHDRLRWLRPWRRWDTRWATSLVVWWGRLRWSWVRHVPRHLEVAS